VTAYDSAIIADGPVGYWMLNETAGTVATDSMGANNGTYTGGITLGQAGIPDGSTSVKLDGAAGSYIDLGNPAALGITGDMSVEVWVKWAQASSFAALITKTTTNTPGPWDWYIQAGGSTPQKFFRNPASINGTHNLGDGNWHHLIATFTGSNAAVTLYCDGASDGSSTSGAPASNGSTHARIGSRDDGATTINGWLAKAAIYNKVLNAGQASAHYAAATGGGASVATIADTRHTRARAGGKGRWH